MAQYAIIHQFSSGTPEQYENAVKSVHGEGGALPAGQIVHVAGQADDGSWIVVAVHDSKESWEAFRDDVLLPGLPQVENGLPGPPQETAFEVHNHQTA